MRKEVLLLGVIVLFAAISLALVVALRLLLPWLNTTEEVGYESQGVAQPAATTLKGDFDSTTLTQESSTSTMAYDSSTTMKTGLRKLAIILPEEAFYKNDDVVVSVVSGGDPVSGVGLVVDSGDRYSTDGEGRVVLYSLGGGEHVISVEGDGYAPTTVNLSVSPLGFAYSSEVKVQRTPGERAASIAGGKVVFRFYDRPNCPNCLRMKPWVADIVERNRDCIRYELLRIIYEGPRDELRELLPDQTLVDTPVLVIEGPSGGYVSSGFLSKDSILERVRAAAGGRCAIG